MKTIITFALVFVTFNSLSAQWTEFSTGIPSNVYVQSLHSSGVALYAGTSDGVYISSNSGQSWLQILSGTGTINSITSQASYIYAGSSGAGVYITSNGGMNWSTSLGPVTIWSVAASGNSVYAVIWADRIWKTTNSGGLWEPVSPGGNVKSVAVSEPYIYGGFQNYTSGGNGGVHYSTNNGVNWSIAISGKEIKVVTCSASLVVAGTLDDTSRSGGVYVSENHAQDWVRTSLDSVPVQALKISGNSIIAGIDNHYYPGFQDYAGVWVSTNKGQSWTQRNEGLSGLSNRAISSIEIHNGYAFVSVYGGKIYRRSIDQIIGIRNTSNTLPGSFDLEQNFPNPFNSSTVIRFHIRLNSNVFLRIYDVNGKQVDDMNYGQLLPGTYEVDFDASNLPSGLYFYELISDEQRVSRKMLLIK